MDGGYEGDISDWLKGGPGYTGTISRLTAKAAARPAHVGLCEDDPDLSAIPEGGGIGFWVESHASITLLESSA